MKLQLTDFKYHNDLIIELPQTGLILIHGKSGVGKSTIFNSISFALYGKVRRPCSHGTKSCKVSLSIERFDLNITRTRTPNSLIVNHKGKMYEDVAGQGVIDKIMKMDHSKFEASSYFDQL